MAVSDLVQGTDAPWRTCTVCHALQELPTEQATLLRTVLANPLVRYSDLETELRDDPAYRLELGRDALSRHARGRCSAKERLR